MSTLAVVDSRYLIYRYLEIDANQSQSFKLQGSEWVWQRNEITLNENIQLKHSAEQPSGKQMEWCHYKLDGRAQQWDMAKSTKASSTAMPHRFPSTEAQCMVTRGCKGMEYSYGRSLFWSRVMGPDGVSQCPTPWMVVKFYRSLHERWTFVNPIGNIIIVIMHDRIP